MPLFFKVWLLSTLALACARSPTLLRMEDGDVALEPHEGRTLLTGGQEVRWSSFTVPATAAEQALERRKRAYLALFQDDVDPYTGERTPREKCLEEVRPDYVAARAAHPPDWAGCHGTDAQGWSVRRWRYCPSQGLLWESTTTGLPTPRDGEIVCAQ